MLAHHMEDLKETTHKIHYERFRFDKLREMMGAGNQTYKVNIDQQSGNCFAKFIIQGKASGDIDEEYKRSVRDFERQKLKAGRKNSFLTDIKYKSLDSILGGQRQKVRNIISNLNFK